MTSKRKLIAWLILVGAVSLWSAFAIWTGIGLNFYNKIDAYVCRNGLYGSCQTDLKYYSFALAIAFAYCMTAFASGIAVRRANLLIASICAASSLLISAIDGRVDEFTEVIVISAWIATGAFNAQRDTSNSKIWVVLTILMMTWLTMPHASFRKYTEAYTSRGAVSETPPVNRRMSY